MQFTAEQVQHISDKIRNELLTPKYINRLEEPVRSYVKDWVEDGMQNSLYYYRPNCEK